MSLVETLSLKLTDEQHEKFLQLIHQEPNQHPTTLYRRILTQPENIEELN
jgi:hypothetical protein